MSSIFKINNHLFVFFIDIVLCFFCYFFKKDDLINSLMYKCRKTLIRNQADLNV